MDQGPVAGGMAMGVVDHLQVVDVQIDQAGRRAIAVGEGDHARQLAHEGAAVGGGRQGVAVGQLLQLAQALVGRLDLAAQGFDLLHQGHDRAVDLGRHVLGRDAQDRHGVGDLARCARAVGRGRRARLVGAADGLRPARTGGVSDLHRCWPSALGAQQGPAPPCPTAGALPSHTIFQPPTIVIGALTIGKDTGRDTGRDTGPARNCTRAQRHYNAAPRTGPRGR